jgi:hypothetical protein
MNLKEVMQEQDRGLNVPTVEFATETQVNVNVNRDMKDRLVNDMDASRIESLVKNAAIVEFVCLKKKWRDVTVEYMTHLGMPKKYGGKLDVLY